MKGYLDAKELESYKKEDLQELAKQLGVDAEGTKKEIATRCAAVEVDIPDESELTEEDKEQRQRQQQRQQRKPKKRERRQRQQQKPRKRERQQRKPKRKRQPQSL